MSNTTFRSLLKKLAPEFGLIKEAFDPLALRPDNVKKGDDTENKAKQQAHIEKSVLGQIDRSAKLDEVDTVTFGLETDDNKIVKVYVNAEQAEDFEKELGEKLGEIDDIEEILNELSKKFEIVDVEWPDEAGDDGEEDDADEEDDGSSSMDPRVYKKDKKVDPAKEKEKEADIPAMEGLTYGEKASVQLMESMSSIEQRLTTPAQLLVYHAVLQLGIPEVALNKSPYRSTIVNSIKETAVELSKNPQLKIALKNFVRFAIGDDEKGKDVDVEDNDEDPKAKKEEPKKKPEPKKPEPKKVVKDDDDQEDAKNVKKELSKEPVRDVKKKVVEEAVVPKDEGPWEFEKTEDGFSVSHGTHLKFTLDEENMEHMAKGITAKRAVVVKDVDQKRYTFSPRGVTVLVKESGGKQICSMASDDVSALMEAVTGDEKKEKPKAKPKAEPKEAPKDDKKSGGKEEE